MAKVKPKRHGVVTDMTAMCDVTFLLLTFFIMTTTFKKPDVEAIKPPSSISEKVLPDANLMTIDVTPGGKFYFQPVENPTERKQILAAMGKKYGIQFTETEANVFGSTQAFGVPMNKLKGFLDLPEDARKSYKDPTGIPMDSVNKQLIDWVEQSLAINPNYNLAVKGDVTTQYTKVKSLFEGLRDINFLKFWLITSQEGKPQN